jgi:hypothetical protein
MADTTIPALMDGESFLDELGRLDAKPQTARPRVGGEHIAPLDRGMRAIAADAALPYNGPAALIDFDATDAGVLNGSGEPRGLAPVLMLGLAVGAAAAAIVLHERLASILARVW